MLQACVRCLLALCAARPRTKTLPTLWYADNTPVDFEALRPYSSAASAKDRGYVPAPAASETVRSNAAQQAAAVTAAAAAVSGDETSAAPANSTGAGTSADARPQRVNSAMSRPGPSVRAEDMSTEEAPFAGHVPLEKPSKYRCARCSSVRMQTQLVFAVFCSDCSETNKQHCGLV